MSISSDVVTAINSNITNFSSIVTVEQACQRSKSMDTWQVCVFPVDPQDEGGMRHTSMALYFYGASKKSLHKPRTTSGNRLLHNSYGFIIIYNFYVYSFCIKLTKIFKNSLLASK